MKQRLGKAPLLWLATAALVITAAGCGSSGGGGGGQTSGGGGAKKVKTAIVLPCATSDSWCKQGFDAAKKLQAEGQIDLKITTNAPQDTAGVTRVLAQYAQAGTQLIFAHSTWQDAAFSVAKQFPKVDIATYSFVLKPNVAILEEPIYQAAYLAGMIAGGITKSNVIGGSAGQDVPLCHAELVAFGAGAKRVNPKVKLISTYIGDWNDAAKGKQTTQAQISSGADVVLACGGGPATGMAQAIKQANISGFAYVGDMSAQAPKNMVGSVIYNLEPYFRAAVQDVRNGTFRPAKKYSFGLAQGGVDLQLNPQYSVTKIPSSVMKQMQKVRQEIKSGQFTVPYVPGS